MNTLTIIKSIQEDIQKIIDAEQKKLTDIETSLSNIQQFLLENGYSEIKETDDVLREVIGTIETIKKQNVVNSNDTNNIKKSIKSLESIENENAIDKDIIEKLNKKIESIENEISANNKKLKDIAVPLKVLLNLQTVCPSCRNLNEKDRYNCNYCNGLTFLNIGKILTEKGIIRLETVEFQNDIKKIPTPATEKLQNLQKQQNYNKYTIQHKV